MADYPEALENDPDGVSTALEVGATFWHRGDYADAVKWLRKAVDAAFDEGADERGLELSKAAAILATTVPTTPAPPPPTSIPEPVPPTPPLEEPVVTESPERAREVAPPPASLRPMTPMKHSEPAKAVISASGLPLPRVSGRPSREVSAAPPVRELSAQPPAPLPTPREPEPMPREAPPKGTSATQTMQGTGAPREPAMLTPFAMTMGQRAPTPTRPAEPAEHAAPTRAPTAAETTVDMTAQEINERTPTRPLDEPSVEELVHSAFPDPTESDAPPSPALAPRVRTRLWNSTDALRVAVSREGSRATIRVFDGTDLQDGEIEAVIVGLSGGPELGEMLQVFGDASNSAHEKG